MPFVGGVGLPSSGQPQVYCSITKKQAGESPGSGIRVDNRRGTGGYGKGQPQELNLLLVEGTNKWSDHRMANRAAIKNPSWGQTSQQLMRCLIEPLISRRGKGKGKMYGRLGGRWVSL